MVMRVWEVRMAAGAGALYRRTSWHSACTPNDGGPCTGSAMTPSAMPPPQRLGSTNWSAPNFHGRRRTTATRLLGVCHVRLLPAQVAASSRAVDGHLGMLLGRSCGLSRFGGRLHRCRNTASKRPGLSQRRFAVFTIAPPIPIQAEIAFPAACAFSSSSRRRPHLDKYSLSAALFAVCQSAMPRLFRTGRNDAARPCLGSASRTQIRSQIANASRRTNKHAQTLRVASRVRGPGCRRLWLWLSGRCHRDASIHACPVVRGKTLHCVREMLSWLCLFSLRLLLLRAAAAFATACLSYW
jgi:hypothetical protein